MRMRDVDDEDDEDDENDADDADEDDHDMMRIYVDDDDNDESDDDVCECVWVFSSFPSNEFSQVPLRVLHLSRYMCSRS